MKTHTQLLEKIEEKNMETNNMFGEIEEIIDEVEKTYNSFKNFDMIDHPPHDHHYYNPYYEKNEKNSSDSSCSSFMEKIKQELSVLEKNIPNSIFVRSYKHRIDLMRAAIIGPPNTPYHHCLFFFDIKFPKNYPTNPPKIHYLSYGIDLNPNLHLDGKVSIVALLESRFAWLKQNWPGSSNNQEKWDPDESTLLHVLHAIQNMILRKLHSLEKYNRRVFVLTCQKMIKVLKEPPRDFRDFVKGHFRKRAHSILLKFRENEYEDELMIDLFVRMFGVFERNGAYCKHHLYFLRTINQQNSRVNVEAKIRDLESLSAIDQEEAYKVKFDSYNRERCNHYYC